MTTIRTYSRRILLVCTALILAWSALILPPAAQAAEPDANNYFTRTDNLYRYYAPGVIRPDQGTIQMTLKINKPLDQFGNFWDYAFKIIPARDVGSTLMGVYVPALPETGLIFLIRNGSTTAKAVVPDFPYTPGERVNIAVSWGTEMRIYLNGQLKATAPLSEPIRADLIPYVFEVEKAEPFNTEAVKISTRQLSQAELSAEPEGMFKQDADTSFLALNRFKTIKRQKTNWHSTTGFSTVTPVWRAEKQVYAPGEDVVFPVVALNHAATAQTYQVNIVARDHIGGQVAAKEFPLTLPPDSRYRIHELPLPELEQEGHYTLTTTITKGGATVSEWTSAIAMVPQNDTSIADGALADYYGQHPNYDMDPSLMTKMGAMHARSWASAQTFLWNIIEPQPGKFDWTKPDNYVAAMKRAGMKDIIGVLGYPGRWAAEESPQEFQIQHDYARRPERWKPADLDEWANYVYQTANRYKDSVKYWEIYNEVNFHPPGVPASFSGTTEEYFELLRIAYQEIKRANPDAQVLVSGFSEGDNTDLSMPLQILDDPYANGYFDIYNVHGYAGTAKVQPFINKLKLKRPDTPYWMTEHMWFTESDKNKRLYKTIDWFMSFMGEGYERFYNMGTFEVFFNRYTFSPEADYYVVSLFQNQLRKAEQYMGKYEFPNQADFSMRHYMRRTDGKYWAVIGSNLGNYELTVNGGGLEATDMFGKPLAVQQAGGQSTFVVPGVAYVLSEQPLQITEAENLGGIPLYKNGSFEEIQGDAFMGLENVTPSDWIYREKSNDPNGKIGVHTAARTGQYAMEVSAAGGGEVYFYQDVDIRTTGLYEVSAYYRKAPGATSQLDPYLFFYNRTAGQVVKTPLVGITEDGYIKLTYTFELASVPSMASAIGFGIKGGSGKVWIDDVSLTYLGQLGTQPPEVQVPLIDDSKKVYIDLSANANQTYSDDVAGDGQGGWADMGPENIAASDFVTGERTLRGIPFQLKSRGEDETVIALGGSIRPELPEQVSGIPVNQKLAKIGFLHTAMWAQAAKGQQVGEYIIRYEDGTSVSHPIVFKQNIDDWYVPNVDPGVKIADKFSMPATGERALFHTLFENPHPDKTIASIDMRSERNAILIWVAATGERL